MRFELLVQLIFMMGFKICPIFSGFGIITSWPKRECLSEIRKLKFVLRYFLPSSYFYTEPMIVSSQELIIFVWRRDDQRARAYVAEHKGMFGAIYQSVKV
jgi:hypothetical protein